jgi:hypothetical protein
MREPRNPFRLRASEHIESDTTFVRLFGPGMLDLLKSNDGLDRLRILRSAPGGGKTTLMRLFTPGPLLTLHSFRLQEDCKELYQRMCELGGVSDVGPRLLGVMISCDRNYAALADMGLDPIRQLRTFFALLDARLMMAALRGALALKRLNYPADLDRLEIIKSENAECPPGIQIPCKGSDLYNWAKKLENSICDALDSFGGLSDSTINGSDRLFTLKLLSAGNLQYGGVPVAARLLIMLDDVQKLTRSQRQGLMDTVMNLRINTGIWLAERLEALAFCDLVSQGAIMGRDYEYTYIENSWREKPKQFEKLALNIAQRRADQAIEVETQSFSGALETSLEDTKWQPKFEEALALVKNRVKQKDAKSGRYTSWVSERERQEGTPRQQAVAWRMLEILIEREERKNQGAFNFALNVQDLEAKDDSSLRTAAELFLSWEFKSPYFFGSSTLTRLASSNIEQFLWLAGDEFEEVASANVINPKEVARLSPERQESILRKASQFLWDEIPRRLPRGRSARLLLESIAEFSNWQTYRPNAPYDPGVNGVAISMQDRERLMDPSYVAKYPHHGRLAEILAAALANNFLEVQLDYSVKGDRWMILNLNRLLCVRHKLPLNYGKFREKTLDELSDWMEHGFKRPEKELGLFGS